MLLKTPKQINITIRERTFKFAVRIILFSRCLPKDMATVILIRQIIRSGTSIGANVEEANGAFSKADFIHCMNIAKKEARETLYWLRLIYEISSPTIQKRMEILLIESEEIVKVLTKSVRTAQMHNTR